MLSERETIAELKKLNKPVLIYGNSVVSKEIKDFLFNNGITTAAFVVDEAYYKPNTFIDDVKVENIANFIDDFDNYSLVNGFINILKSKIIMKNNPALMRYKKIYIIWNAAWTWSWNEEWLSENNDILSEMSTSLGDGLSKRTLKALVKAKSTGECEDIINVSCENQYFNELTYNINPHEEIYVDCGAFNGDTILKYDEFVNDNYKKIFAFEPLENNIAMLRKNTDNMRDIEVIKGGGVWSKRDTLYFDVNSASPTTSSISYSTTNNKIEVYAIDDIVKDEKVTFIKMDIEGSELEALKGSEKTIKNNMPKLAVCTYHRKNDIIDIYNYAKQFETKKKKYKFFLRHHSYSSAETVLYAIPIDK